MLRWHPGLVYSGVLVGNHNGFLYDPCFATIFFYSYLFFILLETDWYDGLDEHMWCWDGYCMEEMKAWKIAMR